MQFGVPPLNAEQAERLQCAEYTNVDELLASLPDHVFLAGSNGERVVTTDEEGRTYTWVRLDIADAREAVLIVSIVDDGRLRHFSCADNLRYTGDWIKPLQRDSD